MWMDIFRHCGKYAGWLPLNATFCKQQRVLVRVIRIPPVCVDDYGCDALTIGVELLAYTIVHGGPPPTPVDAAAGMAGQSDTGSAPAASASWCNGDARPADMYPALVVTTDFLSCDTSSYALAYSKVLGAVAVSQSSLQQCASAAVGSSVRLSVSGRPADVSHYDGVPHIAYNLLPCRTATGTADGLQVKCVDGVTFATGCGVAVRKMPARLNDGTTIMHIYNDLLGLVEYYGADCAVEKRFECVEFTAVFSCTLPECGSCSWQAISVTPQPSLRQCQVARTLFRTHSLRVTAVDQHNHTATVHIGSLPHCAATVDLRLGWNVADNNCLVQAYRHNTALSALFYGYNPPIICKVEKWDGGQSGQNTGDYKPVCIDDLSVESALCALSEAAFAPDKCIKATHSQTDQPSASVVRVDAHSQTDDYGGGKRCHWATEAQFFADLKPAVRDNVDLYCALSHTMTRDFMMKLFQAT